jgi:replication factor C large subunit
MDLQAVATGKNTLTEKDLEVLGERNRVKQIFEALRYIFYAKSIRGARAAIEGLELEPQAIYTWILDNAPTQITEPDELAQAFDLLARADIYFARIEKLQMWRLMKYAIPVMTGGVAVARRTPPKGFQKFTFPHRIRLFQQYKNEREIRQSIAWKIASRLHLSSYKAGKEMLPYIGFIISHADKSKPRVAEYFEFTDGEVEYLKKTYGGVEEKKDVIKEVKAKKPVKRSRGKS